MVLAFSSLISRLQKTVLPFSLLRQSEKMFMRIFNEFLRSFNYRCKVVITTVGNIIGIGYGNTIIKGTLKAKVFRDIRNLIPFHVFLISPQFVSKYSL